MNEPLHVAKERDTPTSKEGSEVHTTRKKINDSKIWNERSTSG